MESMNTKLKPLLRLEPLKLLLAALLGAILCYFIMTSSVDFASALEILYVSQDELMDLENARIKNESASDRQLFFGRIDEAAKLATSIPKTLENKYRKVIYSVGSVSGQNVVSISKEIHQKIIQELQKPQKLQSK